MLVRVHTPETPGERGIEQINAQAAKHGLKFPNAVDNEGSNCKAPNNSAGRRIKSSTGEAASDLIRRES